VEVEPAVALVAQAVALVPAELGIAVAAEPEVPVVVVVLDTAAEEAAGTVAVVPVEAPVAAFLHHTDRSAA